MSLILGIETATPVCGVALTRGEQLVGEYRLNIKNIHASVLVSMIDRLLADCKCELTDIQAIAVSIGPGSFTGLRIGLATVKGLAMVNETPLIAVSTPAALAHSTLWQQGNITVLIRSRKNEFYATTFIRDHDQDTLVSGPRVISMLDLPRAIPADHIIIAEPSIELPSLDEKFILRFTYPSALAVARLGYQKFLQGLIAPIDTLERDYIQEFIAGPTVPASA